MQSKGSSRWHASQKPKFWWHILACIPCVMLLSKTWMYVEMAYSSRKITNSAPLLSSLACNRKWNFVAKAWAFCRQKKNFVAEELKFFANREETFGAEVLKIFAAGRRIWSWSSQVFSNRKNKNLELEQLSILQQEEEIRAELLEHFANEKKKNF